MTDNSPRPAKDLPHALDNFAALREMIAGRGPALFFDYDGTLTPIVPRPEDAILSDKGRAVITDLKDRLPVAIISGRDRPVVEQLVGVPGLIYAGSHGFDIDVPGDANFENPVGGDFTALLDGVEARLHEALNALDGAQIERKKYSIAAHNRNVAPADQGRVEEAVRGIMEDHTDDLKVMPGKCVFEIQPKLDWDKGKCLLWLIDALDLNRPDVVPFFFGDDITDEHAFSALAEGDKGIGVIVSDPEDAKTHGTAANFRVDTPDQLYDLLARLTANG